MHKLDMIAMFSCHVKAFYAHPELKLGRSCLSIGTALHSKAKYFPYLQSGTQTKCKVIKLQQCTRYLQGQGMGL